MIRTEARSSRRNLPRIGIDFIFDLTCPWCAIGLATLEQAIARVDGVAAVELRLQPFELNPRIARDGEPIAAYAERKYGASATELAQRQTLIRARAAEAGLAFIERTHVYPTFDAHRLMHWAQGQGRALALAHALFDAYHGRGGNPALPEVLLRAAVESGLDAQHARQVIESGAGAAEVRTAVRRWQQLGIDAVPAILAEGRWLIQGSQPVELLEEALRRIAASQRAAA